MKARIIFHGAAVLLLLGTVAVAQEAKDKTRQAPAVQSPNKASSTPSASGREVQSGMTTGRRSGSIIVVDRQSASGITAPREAGSGMATGRMAKPSQTDPDGSSSSRNSAHATESLTTSATDQVHSNPLYQSNGNQGTNPLHESKDKAAGKPATGGTPSKDVVEYKDGEDGTTRTRPGNKKTN